MRWCFFGSSCRRSPPEKSILSVESLESRRMLAVPWLPDAAITTVSDPARYMLTDHEVVLEAGNAFSTFYSREDVPTRRSFDAAAVPLGAATPIAYAPVASDWSALPNTSTFVTVGGTWTSGKNYRLIAERFSAAGATLTGGATIDVGMLDIAPSVQSLTDGGYVVAWTDRTSEAGAGAVYRFYGQRFSDAGSAVGAHVLFHTIRTPVGTSGDARVGRVDLAPLPDGGYVAAWVGFTFTSATGGTAALKTQAFAATGTSVAAATSVASRTFTLSPLGGGYSNPSLSTNASGRGVVSWSEPGATPSGPVRFQRLTAAGATDGTQVSVGTSTHSFRDELGTAAGIDDTGRVVVAWTKGSTIRASFYDASNVSLGADAVVNDSFTSSGGAGDPTIELTFGPTGDFAVSWAAVDALGKDRLQLRRFRHAAPSRTISGIAETSDYAEDATTPTLLAPAAELANADGLTLAGGTLRVLVSGGIPSDNLEIRDQGSGSDGIDVRPPDLFLNDVRIGSFTGGGATTLEVSLLPAATARGVETLLRCLQFSSPGDNPTDFGAARERTIQISLLDADKNVIAAATQTLSVSAVNDAPTITSDDVFRYTLDTAAAPLLPTATVTDADNADLRLGRLSVTFTEGAHVENNLRLGTGFSFVGSTAIKDILFERTTIGRMTSSGSGKEPLVISFNAAATPAIVEKVVRAVEFKTRQGTSAARRTVSFHLDDGRRGTVTLTTSFTPNQSPRIDIDKATLLFEENGPALRLAPAATVSDADSASFGGGTLTASVSGSATRDDRLGIATSASVKLDGSDVLVVEAGKEIPIGKASVAATPVASLEVKLNDSATPARVQSLLRAIAYANASDNPAAMSSSRTVELRIADGSGGSCAVSRRILIKAMNDAPAIAGFGEVVRYYEADAPVAIAPRATVTDVDSSTFVDGRLTVKVVGATAGDRLTIATGAGITLTGTVVRFQGRPLGDYAQRGNTSFTLVLKAAATPDTVQRLLRSLRFDNSTSNPSESARSIEVTLKDGASGVSNTASNSLEVVGYNDVPIIEMDLSGEMTYVNNSASLPIAPEVVVTDDGLFKQVSIKVATNVVSDGSNVLEVGSQYGFKMGGGVLKYKKYKWAVIGTATSVVTSSETSLTVVFSNSSPPATSSLVQSFFRSIRFRTVNNTSTFSRTVIFKVWEADFDTQRGDAQKVIHVTSV